MRPENRISVFFKGKTTRDPLAFVACHCRDGKPRIRISGGVGRATDVRSFDRAVLNFCPRAKAIERATWPPADSAIFVLDRFACDELLHGRCGVDLLKVERD